VTAASVEIKAAFQDNDFSATFSEEGKHSFVIGC
jgi:hypothetical protein